ncbi:MAG: hypothetical protein QXS38_01075 [Candidatus Pacearchaeota archaeon]
MNKRGAWWLWVSVGLIFLLIITSFFYFALFASDNSKVYSGIEIKNPISDLTDEAALVAFDESFIFYLLYSIKAYNLHAPPLSSDYPRIEVEVSGEPFSATVLRGVINVSKGKIAKEDIIIRTTKEEAIKMLRDKNYIMNSFNEGKSRIELVAGQTTLFAKGYLNMYNEITGKSVTSNTIKIFTS